MHSENGTQDYFIHHTVSSWEEEDFSVHRDNSMSDNGHRMMDQLHRFRIVRARHSAYSPYLISFAFWIFRDFEGKPKGRHLQGSGELIAAVQESMDNVTLMIFK
jgi:hypothetical protein